MPERGQQIAYNANRDGGAERFPAPAGQKNMDVDLALLAHDDRRRRARALAILKTATQPDATTRDLLRPVPGMGELLSLVLLDDIHDLQRFPRVPECVSYGRVGNWAQESAGKRAGTSGSKIGKASLQWAFAAAAGRCWRANPAGQQSRARVEKQHRTGQALTVLAPK